MTASLTHNGRAPYHLTLPHSVAQAGTCFFLLFLFMWPFQGALFLADNLFDIQGFKPFNLLSAVVLAYLVFDTAPLHATDKIERTSIRIFLLYFAMFAIALIRSVPNAPLLHSRFPGIPGSYVDFVLSACIVPTFYTLAFLFILRRMCSFQELEKITTVICLSILLLSISFVALVLMNPSVLLSGHAGGMTDSDRDEIAQLCIAYLGSHYNIIGGMFISTVPLLLYRALTRGALWIAPLCLSLLAVLLLESRTALVAVAASCSLFLILRRRFGILVFGAGAASVTSLVWSGPTVDALLSIGVGSGFSADALLTGRVDYIWRPLLEEWTSNIGLFLFGAGRYGIGTSQLWNTGALLEKNVAHNAIIEFFLDCGVILTGVALMFLMAGTVTAWRVGRRLNSDLYWALFASMFGCGISMTTGRAILPSIENMYAFPIIAMMINLARLHYLNAYRSRPNDDSKA